VCACVNRFNSRYHRSDIRYILCVSELPSQLNGIFIIFTFSCRRCRRSISIMIFDGKIVISHRSFIHTFNVWYLHTYTHTHTSTGSKSNAKNNNMKGMRNHQLMDSHNWILFDGTFVRPFYCERVCVCVCRSIQTILQLFLLFFHPFSLHQRPITIRLRLTDPHRLTKKG